MVLALTAGVREGGSTGSRASGYRQRVNCGEDLGWRWAGCAAVRRLAVGGRAGTNGGLLVVDIVADVEEVPEREERGRLERLKHAIALLGLGRVGHEDCRRTRRQPSGGRKRDGGALRCNAQVVTRSHGEGRKRRRADGAEEQHSFQQHRTAEISCSCAKKKFVPATRHGTPSVVQKRIQSSSKPRVDTRGAGARLPQCCATHGASGHSTWFLDIRRSTCVAFSLNTPE